MRNLQPIFYRSLRDSLSLPAFILFFTMMGFGSFARSAGFDSYMTLASSMLIWGLPGQLVMVELASTGKGVVAAVFACSLANARFLPMVVSFLPQIANRSFTLVQLIIYAQLLSINSWAMCQRQFPTIEPAHRLFYYLVFATSILLAAAAGTLIGYHAAVALPNALVLGLIFSSPLFFALVLSSTARNAHRLALLLGCLMVPGLHAIFPSIDLLIAGAIGGSVAYCLRKRVERE